jgi:pyruvate kinase
MSNQITPSFTEMGDISNVVREYIDGIMLTGETTFGLHPIEVIQSLQQVCRKVEKKCLAEKTANPSLRDHYYIFST